MSEPETTIYSRMKAMQDQLSDHHAKWSDWFNLQPDCMCELHPGIKRSVNVEKSVARSWQERKMTAVYRKCWKCVREAINKRNRN